MLDKIYVRELPPTLIKGKTRTLCVVECPDCSKQREIRKDSYKIAETTLCRSCNNKRRPTKAPEDLFNHKKFYRTPRGKASTIYTCQLRKCKERNYSLPTYSREELITFLLNSPVYLELFTTWKASGFLKTKAPSVDRINDYKSYTFDNIQIITWKANNDKYSQDTLTGKSTKTCKAVDQLDLNGKFIKRFYSQQEAGRQLKVDSSKISAMCLGVLNCTTTSPQSVAGHKWRFSSIPNTKKEHIN